MVKKILIVENNLLLSMINKRYCEYLGHQVIDSVMTGAAAIESAKKNKPDVIIMDIRIDGDIDGIETMLEIKKFSNVKAIYVTGNSEAAMKQKAETTNMLAFCVKPTSFEDIKEILERDDFQPPVYHL